MVNLTELGLITKNFNDIIGFPVHLGNVTPLQLITAAYMVAFMSQHHLCLTLFIRDGPCSCHLQYIEITMLT